MKNVIYMSDLDGTLLRKDSKLSDFTKDVLNELLKLGILITIASARSRFKILELLNGVKMLVPYIALNGAQLVDPVSGSVIKENIVNQNQANEILEISDRFGLIPLILGEQDDRDILAYSSKHSQKMEEFILQRDGDSRLYCFNEASFWPDKIYVLNYLGEKNVLEKMESELLKKSHLDIGMNIVRDVYIDNCYSLEIRNSKSDKSKMVHVLCEDMNFRIEDICYFGDELNDLKIFDIVGKRIAVSNANELIKSSADKIIRSNQEDGVANFLNDIYKVVNNGKY